ncbi:hypothetical protein BH11MYX4_BH11MYX4_35850 [soil metagenome]
MTGLLLTLLVACKREPAAGGDAGAPSPPPVCVPAPNSPLARELGTDDAGRGEYRAYDDGPWCGFSPRVDRKLSLGTSYEAEDASYAFFETDHAPPDGPRDGAQKTMLELTLRAPSRVVASPRIRTELSLANRSPNPLAGRRPSPSDARSARRSRDRAATRCGWSTPACAGAERRPDPGEEPVPPDLFDGTIASNGILVEVTAAP